MSARLPRHPRGFVRVTLLASGALVVLALAVAAWLLFTTAGARFVLSSAGVAGEGLEGSLAGGLRAESLRYELPKLRVSVKKPEIDWSPMALFAGRLQLDRVTAAEVEVATAPGEGAARPPAMLVPRLPLRVERAGVGLLRLSKLGAKPGESLVELRDIALRAEGNPAAWIVGALEATTVAGRATVRGTIGTLSPFPLDASGELAGERGTVRHRISATAKGSLAKIDVRARGESGGIAGDASADIEPFATQPVRRLVARLSGVDVAAFAGAPKTKLAIDADLAPEGDALAGKVAVVNSEPGSLDRGAIPVTRLAGRLKLAKGRYEIAGAAIELAGGGAAKGEGVLADRRLRAKVEVTALDLATWHGKLRPTKLAGTIAADTDLGVQRFEVDLKEPRFEIAGRAQFAGGRFVVETARLARGDSVLEARGSLALSGQRDFELAGTLAHLDPAAFAAAPAGDLNATLSAKGVLNPALAGEAMLELGESRFAGLAAGGRAAVVVAGRRLERGEASLRLGETKLEAKGAFGRAGDALRLALSSPDLAPLGKALGVALAGRVDLDATATGTLEAPAGRAELKAAALELPGALAISAADAKVEIGPEADSRVEGTLALRGLGRRAGATLVESASATLAGTRSDHRLALDSRLSKEWSARLALQGGLSAGAEPLAWNGRVDSLAVEGPVPFALTVPAAFTASPRRVELGEATLKGEWGEARLARTLWTPEAIEARGTGRGVPVRTIARLLRLPASPRSTLAIAADWDLRIAETVEGAAHLRRESGDVRVGDPRVALGLEKLDASLEASGGEVRAAIAIEGSTLGRIAGRAATRLRHEAGTWTLPPGAPLDGALEADVPSLRWAAAWIGPDAELEGRLRGAVKIGGTVQDPAWSGGLQAEGVKVREPLVGLTIDEGGAELAFDNRELRLTRFELSTAWRPSPRVARRLEGVKVPGKGTVSASGALDLGSRSGAIVVRADAFPATQLPNRFLAVSGEARIEAKASELAVTGALRADAGFFGIASAAPPSLSDDVLVEREGERAGARLGPRIGLDLRVSLGEHLFFTGRGLRTQLAGDVRLRGEPGRGLVATGSIRAVGGTYDAYGQQLAIERGALNFQGSLENPGLNVLAVRTGLPVVAGVEILGTVARPKARLYSSPEVPDHEKLSWLVLGRGPAQASEGDVATLLAAANALMGDERVGRRLVGAFPIDHVRVGRDEGTSALGAMPQSTIAGKTGSTSGAEVVSVGKRLTKDLYVSYQQSLADAEQTLRVSWQLTEAFQLILKAGDKPGLDAVYRFTFE